MKKIIEYKIMWGEMDSVLEEKVNKEIKEGWQPFGSVFMRPTEKTDYFHQPMVKYEL
ncbi:MAG: DUF1737 domain-containing protein [Nanoarchaeota archaeon]